MSPIRDISVSCVFTAREVATWWHEWVSDPTCIGAYADPVIDDLAAFLSPARTDRIKFWLIYGDGVVVGATWLHDLSSYGSIRTGWLAMYHIPAYRRLIGSRSQQAVIAAASEMGIGGIFAACRTSNLAARRSLCQGGFGYVGTMPEFCMFDGAWDAVHVFSLRAQDRVECWRQAQSRAAEYRARWCC